MWYYANKLQVKNQIIRIFINKNLHQILFNIFSSDEANKAERSI
jgi:hypothetical protein